MSLTPHDSYAALLVAVEAKYNYRVDEVWGTSMVNVWFIRSFQPDVLSPQGLLKIGLLKLSGARTNYS